MASEDEWGPWIEHDGKGCPCVGQVTEARWLMEDGRIESTSYSGEVTFLSVGSGSWSWVMIGGKPVCHEEWCAPILRYRIRKPRGLVMLEQILADLPAPKIPA